MFSVTLDAVDKVLDDFLADLVAEGRVVVEDGAHGLRLQQAGGQKQLDVLVKQSLVLGIPWN